MERSQRRLIERSLLKVLQQIRVVWVLPISLVLPSSTQRYPCHDAEKWKYFVSVMVRISPLPSSMQFPPIFIILYIEFLAAFSEGFMSSVGISRSQVPRSLLCRLQGGVLVVADVPHRALCLKTSEKVLSAKRTSPGNYRTSGFLLNFDLKNGP